MYRTTLKVSIAIVILGTMFNGVHASQVQSLSPQQKREIIEKIPVQREITVEGGIQYIHQNQELGFFHVVYKSKEGITIGSSTTKNRGKQILTDEHAEGMYNLLEVLYAQQQRHCAYK